MVTQKLFTDANKKWYYEPKATGILPNSKLIKIRNNLQTTVYEWLKSIIDIPSNAILILW